VLIGYLAHYNTARPHRGIGLGIQVSAPGSDRAGRLVAKGPVERVDVLGGVVHEYRRAA